LGRFDSPNFRGVSLERLLKMPDAELDRNPWPFLCTRRWVLERYDEWFNEWFNGGVENSPLWASRVLGEFPRDSSNALFPPAVLEQARRASADPGGPVTMGVDVAGPGKDRTVAVATAGGAILDVGIWTVPDSTGVTPAFLKNWASRLRIAKVDSTGLGFHFVTVLHREGFAAEGLNAASSAQEKERFSNSRPNGIGICASASNVARSAG
jgi:phage terminase large subunit